MALSWCKVASNLDSHPKIRRAGRAGREVFLFALRRNAEPDNPEPGYLPRSMLEFWYLADLLMMSETDAVTGVTAAVTAGLLAEDGDRFAIVGWEEDWGKTGGSGADRTARWRENKRMRGSVTGVTSPKVTRDSSDACDALDKKRSEEKRLEEKEKNSARLSGGGSRVRKPKPSGANEAEREVVTTVLEKLGQHTDTRYSGADEHVRLIVGRLRDGLTEMDLRSIVGYCAHPTGLGWTEKPELAKYLRPETLFGPKTISRYLDAARSWYSKHIAPSEGVAA